MIFQGFRLLMEYHSFLLIKCSNQLMVIISFRLLMEYHSFLFLSDYSKGTKVSEFPSPYGVIFILTKIVSKSFTTHQAKNFRLLTELYSFLLYVMTLLIKSLSHTSFRLLMEYHSFLFST